LFLVILLGPPSVLTTLYATADGGRRPCDRRSSRDSSQ
jgi:hypothetical protein